MKLSELPEDLGLAIVRDAEFHNLGFFFDDLENKLAFVEAFRFVPPARKAKGICAILCPPELASSFSQVQGLATTAEPRRVFFLVQKFLVERTRFYGVPLVTEIHPSARIHPRAWIAEQGVRIGPDSVVEANVVIDHAVIVGSHVRIGAGSVIGAEGFQPARLGHEVLQMAHGGGVKIEDHAEIFANAVVARGVFRQSTTIGEYARVGNGAFISHNVQIGKRSFVGHNAVVNGNTVVGDDAWIGPNATIANLLRIGERATVTLGATVIESVVPGARVTGMTALPHRRLLRHIASIASRPANQSPTC